MHNVTVLAAQGKHVYYPIGNTPAVNLLSHHSSREENAADILLLACGDPRSILYTLWCEGKPEEERFNFTCCDVEPAIIARNVLLLSLILDNADLYDVEESKKLSSFWNIFYHFFISKNDLELVREQCLKLLDHSETAEKWECSPYSVLKFVSQQTIAETRLIWTKFSEIKDDVRQRVYDKAVRLAIKHEYDDSFGIGAMSQTLYAGPHWQSGIETMNESLRGYWTTGVAGGIVSDVEALGANKGFSNPLMMVSSMSDEFIVHPTSDPLTSFHLTEIFDKVKGGKKDVLAMVTLARRQFREWSKAFAEYAKFKNVRVNMYCGDAITFSHELAARNGRAPSAAGITRVYASAWSPKPLLLDGAGAKDLPLFFDVIDTSNIVDSEAILNVLPPLVNLLAARSSSVLWTESFRLWSDEPKDHLSSSLFMDVSLASLLLGVAPMGYILGYGLDNIIGEDIIHLDDPNRYRMRIPWKVVIDHETKSSIFQDPKAHRVHFEAKELAEIFFKIYLDMFEMENLEKSMKKRPLKAKIFNRYSRLSFANLIQHALRRIVTDKKAFLTSLRSKIVADDTLHVGADCVVDLASQLSISGTLPNELSPGTGEPPFTCVTLVVPRSALRLVKRLGGMPGIHLAIEKNKKSALFFSIDCFFGSVSQDKDGNWANVVHDPLGLDGRSDLIITAAVPQELVEKSAGKWDCYLLVTLSLLSMDYMQELGPEMTIFHAASKDKRRIFTSQVPPGTHPSRTPRDLFNPILPPEPETQQPIVISATQSMGSLVFQATYTLAPNSEEAIALGNAALVTLTDVSPCSILLNVGEKHSCRVIFPYPIDAAKVKTRIARKSLWIEIKVPAASALLTGGFESTPFPLVIESGRQPFSWSLPRIDLSKQPRIRGNRKGWVINSLHQYTSKRECGIVQKGPKSSSFSDEFPFYKVRVNDILTSVAKDPTQRVFMITPKGDTLQPAGMILIVNCIRHSRETGGMIIDGWIYSCTGFDTPERRARETGATGTAAAAPIEEVMMARMISTDNGIIYKLRKEEIQIWKQLLPAAVESCRRDWKHKDTCEYLIEGKAPLSVELARDPLCSCGRGMDVAEYPAVDAFVGVLKEWVTRVALLTIPAAPYLEATGNIEVK